MGLPAFSLSVDFVQETCINCGCPFGVPSEFQRHRKNSHASFYCPNGHPMIYPGESDVEIGARLLREERARHQRTLERANESEREAERLKKRVSRGACPCCKRSFTNLHRHMKTKHPNYSK